MQNKYQTDAVGASGYVATEKIPAPLNAAITLLESGKYKEASRLLEISLRESSQTTAVPLHWCLGWSYALDKDRDRAISAFRRAAELTPERPESFLYLGEMSRSAGDLPGACEMWWQALTLAWRQENSLVVQIAAAFLAGAQVTASDNQEEVVRQHLTLIMESSGWSGESVHPSQIPFLVSLVGNLLLQSQQYPTACWLLRGRTENSGGFAIDAYQLAYAEERLGRQREAARAYKLTLQKEPGHWRARQALCRLELRRLNLFAAVYHFGMQCWQH